MKKKKKKSENEEHKHSIFCFIYCSGFKLDGENIISFIHSTFALQPK